MTEGNGEHIEIGNLYEFVRTKGTLDPQSQSHLEACSHCRSRLNWMQAMSGLGNDELEYEPPDHAVEKVLEIGRSGGFANRMRNTLVAVLTFDSFNDLIPADVRKSEAGSRQMTYEADGLEISLWMRRSEDQALTLIGQILDKAAGPLEGPGQVDLIVEGDHVRISTLSSWGEFRFENLPSDQYSLQISFPNRIVRIPSVPILEP